MQTHETGLVGRRQMPLRDHYAHTAADAWITDSAHTCNACDIDPFHGSVVPANASGPIQFGIHRAVGGDHDLPNPGDLLAAALAACLDSTLRMLADHLGVRLRFLEVEVRSQCDVRGCLLVERGVPVGFQKMACRVRLRTEGDVHERLVQALLAAAEASCVVLQTLRHGVAVETRIDARDAANCGNARAAAPEDATQHGAARPAPPAPPSNPSLRRSA
jgi:uncharacterized OsmC-like protein